MAAYKCKMCGGDLIITEGNNICECEFCGTQQTIPSVENDKKVNLFNRANRLRMNAEFDKAATVYASITAEFPEEAEAYWGLCLCKYGIEYVDDPLTGNKIPTCHRTLTTSIMDDSDFDQACENADLASKRFYREEAKTIDRLQREILDIVANEPPYDVFICYKETDDDGNRTEDSILGQDIYDSLSAKGLKVFFARLSLEDKLGQQYEPYIYAALVSAKVMLAIGTDYEYFNAVWVKNEWTRFLNMMKSDREKVLIPCFKGIDAYDMPREFKNLQAQDMNKLGWLQDLTRGVIKFCGKNDKDQDLRITGQSVPNSSPTIENLLRRAFIFLEDRDWDAANHYAERVLDIDAENAQAYVVKLLAKIKVPSQEALSTQVVSLAEYPEYEKILRFGDDDTKSKFSSYQEDYRRTAFAEGLDVLKNAKTKADFEEALSLFETAGDYIGAKEKVSICKEQLLVIEKEEKEKEENEEEKRKLYRKQGRCQYCGGQFMDNLFIHGMCMECGRKKDY